MDAISPGGKTDARILEEIFSTRVGRASAPGEHDGLLEAYLPLLTTELASSQAFRLMPSVLECLESVADVPLGIATGNVRGAAEAKLARAGLAARFGFGGYGCDSADRAELVAIAIERGRAQHGEVDNGDIVVVGDTSLDVAAARACGVAVIAVATGAESRADLLASGPDAVFDTLAELPLWHRARPRRRPAFSAPRSASGRPGFGGGRAGDGPGVGGSRG